MGLTIESRGGRLTARKPFNAFEKAQAALGHDEDIPEPKKVTVPPGVRLKHGMNPAPTVDIAPEAETPGEGKVGGLDDVEEKAEQVEAQEERERVERIADALPPIVSVGDFLASDYPKPKPLIEGIAYEATKTVLAGPSKRGKTWMLIDIVGSVGLGVPFLDTFATKPGRVLFINPEVHEAFLQERLSMWAMARGVNPNELNDQFSIQNIRGKMPFSPDDVKGAGLVKYLDGLRVLIGRAGREPFKLIVFDSVFKLLSGLEENSNTDMAVATGLFDRFLVDVGNPAALLAFHYGKGNQAEKDELDRVVGAGVVTRDCDGAMLLTHHAKKKLGYMSFSVVNRNLAKPDSLVLKLNAPTWEIVEGEDPSKLHSQRGPGKSLEVEELLDALKLTNDGLDLGLFAKEHGVAYRTVERRLSELREAGNRILVEGKKAILMPLETDDKLNPVGERRQVSKKQSVVERIRV